MTTCTTPRNSQNDRIYVHSAVKKRRSRLSSVEHQAYISKSVMLNVTVSTLGCTDIHFLEPSVKVNGEY